MSNTTKKGDGFDGARCYLGITHLPQSRIKKSDDVATIQPYEEPMLDSIPPMYNNAITRLDEKLEKRFVPEILKEENILTGLLRGYSGEQAITTCHAPLRDLTDSLPHTTMEGNPEYARIAGHLAGVVQDLFTLGIGATYWASRAIGLLNPEAHNVANNIQSDRT